MRAVIISGPLPTTGPGAIGGVAIHTRRLVDELQRAGRPVRVLDDSHAYGMTPEGVTGVRGARPIQAGALALRHPLLAASVTGRAVAARERSALRVPLPTAIVRSFLVAVSASGQTDAVFHAQQADYRPLYADWAGIAKPRVVAVHGLGLLQTTPTPALAEIVRANLAAATVVVVPSHALATETTELGVPAERIRVIPNGVDHAVFRLRDREDCRHELGLDPSAPLVVYIGRLTLHKGVTDLLEAWHRVRTALPGAALALVGPASEPLDTAAAGVIAPGAVDDAGASRWLGAADVAVVPSRYEGFGLSALEAMASARPVVATRVGGLSEVVIPDAGILVPPQDPEALAAALLELLRDANAARTAGAAGARAARAFSWEATARAYSTLYDAI